MRSLAVAWTLSRHGWAFCKVSDCQGEAEAFASYVTDAPEDFLRGIAGLVPAETEARVEFQGEPTVFRWFFQRNASRRDQVAHDLGEAGYQEQWGRPFPRNELEGLRTAWRNALVSGS
ncbi:hypothetical protein [Streptomyces sp. N35]|uniref:hypothetical protein n=1 Tax=Streptomyces sp. N35 TaxID=2795730 RepID=UPI0018F3221E|nr:hypothetical protein [Streptomyces sp. N35]